MRSHALRSSILGRRPVAELVLLPALASVLTVLALSCGGGGGGGAPPTAQGQPPVAPANPSLVALSATSVRFTWTDLSTNETGYRVYRGPAGQAHASLVATLGPNAQSFDDGGLTAATTYGYCVHAYSSNGESAAHVGGAVTTQAAASAAIALSPASLSFTAAQGGSGPAAKTVAVTNGGTGTLSGLAVGTITYGAGASGWLQASLSSATAPATVTVTPTLGALTQGTYTASVPVTSTAAGNSPQAIAVTFTVSGPTPSIVLNPTSVTFTATRGGSSPAAKTVAVTNGGTGTLSGLAVGTVTYGAGASGWLAASVSPATAPATLTLTATLGTLAAGSYTATVPVSSSAGGVTNSPQSVAVTFTVSAPAGVPTLNAPSVSGTTITLTWTYTWPQFGSSNDAYYLEESTTGATGGFSQIGSYAQNNGHVSPYSVNLTRAAGSYWYRVRAQNYAGYTGYSAVQSATVTATAPKFTVVNNVLSSLASHQVVQVKLSATGTFGATDLLDNDNACYALPGQSIDVGQSRTFNQTAGSSYYVYLGIGRWDLWNTSFCKRTGFTDTGGNSHNVFTIVQITGHTTGTVTFTISGSYLNGTMRVVVTYGTTVIGTYYFTVT